MGEQPDQSRDAIPISPLVLLHSMHGVAFAYVEFEFLSQGESKHEDLEMFQSGFSLQILGQSNLWSQQRLHQCGLNDHSDIL